MFNVKYPADSGVGGIDSLNSLTGALSLVGGAGITITPAGNDITIAFNGEVEEIVSPADLMLDADDGLVYMWCTDEAFALKSYGGVVAPTLQLFNKDETFYVGIKAANTLAATQVYVLPAVDGNPGDVLSTDGDGNLSWVAP